MGSQVEGELWKASLEWTPCAEAELDDGGGGHQRGQVRWEHQATNSLPPKEGAEPTGVKIPQCSTTC